MITYQKLFNNPAKLLRFTGFDIFQFKVLSSQLKPLWEEEELKRLSRKNRMAIPVEENIIFQIYLNLIRILKLIL
jgi:hypothetical protein